VPAQPTSSRWSSASQRRAGFAASAGGYLFDAVPFKLPPPGWQLCQCRHGALPRLLRLLSPRGLPRPRGARGRGGWRASSSSPSSSSSEPCGATTATWEHVAVARKCMRAPRSALGEQGSRWPTSKGPTTNSSLPPQLGADARRQIWQQQAAMSGSGDGITSWSRRSAATWQHWQHGAQRRQREQGGRQQWSTERGK